MHLRLLLIIICIIHGENVIVRPRRLEKKRRLAQPRTRRRSGARESRVREYDIISVLDAYLEGRGAGGSGAHDTGAGGQERGERWVEWCWGRRRMMFWMSARTLKLSLSSLDSNRLDCE